MIGAHRKNSPRKLKNALFTSLCFGAAGLSTVILAVLLINIFREGFPRVSWEFLTAFPSRFPEKSGIASALLGSLYVIVLTTVIAVPVGLAAAIYLEEFQLRKTWLSQFIQLNIQNLAGVPSIVYGLLGLALFVRWMALGRSIIAGSLTMSLLILPVLITVSQEALKAVPRSFREGSMALGATQWQTIARQVLPSAAPSIMTGIILSISRAIGETAPLIMIGAAAYVAFAPKKITDQFTVLPIQIFNWVSQPQKGFQYAAAGGIVVLLGVLLVMNLVAIVLRNRTERRRG